MIEDLQLHGFAAKTQDAYVRTVKQLAEYYHKSPDLISEEELRQYLLYLTNEKHVAASTFTIALCGLKFFYQQTLQRHWRSSIWRVRRVSRNCRSCSVAPKSTRF